MTAKYRISDFQKSTLAMLEGLDRNANDFFVKAPIVIDCRGDKEAFNLRVSETLRAVTIDKFSKGRLHDVSELGLPAYKYVVEKLRSRYIEFDPNGIKMVRAFLEDWRRETGRKAHQASKLLSAHPSSGIEIILPLENVRVSCAGSMSP
jgi:hypothetical protein